MDYITKKQLLLEQILENTQAQTTAIESDEMDKLGSLINQREIMMAQVDELDNSMEVDSAESPQESIDYIKNILGKIIDIDNANKAIMDKEFDNVKDELRKVRVGMQHGVSYGSDHGLYKEEGLFFDKGK